MKITNIYFLAFLLLLSSKSFAQNIQQQSAWGAIIHSQKISDKIGIHFDAQFRSADNVDYLKNILIRPGITYQINKQSNATLGYLLVLTQRPSENTLAEHRIWEQFVYKYKIGNIPLAHRFRLEQRFIETAGDDIFSQRLRYFVRSVIPLKKDKANFSKGMYAAIQDELFFNLQNKEKLNTHFFDQNRAYLALGYRINSKIDVEAGYLNQAVKGASSNTINHVGQVAIYTRF